MSTLFQSIMESIHVRFLLLFALCFGHLVPAFCIFLISNGLGQFQISLRDFILLTPSVTIPCLFILVYLLPEAALYIFFLFAAVGVILVPFPVFLRLVTCDIFPVDRLVYLQFPHYLLEFWRGPLYQRSSVQFLLVFKLVRSECVGTSVISGILCQLKI